MARLIVTSGRPSFFTRLSESGDYTAPSIVRWIARDERMRRHPFDGLLLALNAADPHHHSFAGSLFPFAVGRQVGLIGMKITGRGRILSTFEAGAVLQVLRPRVIRRRHHARSRALEAEGW